MPFLVRVLAASATALLLTTPAAAQQPAEPAPGPAAVAGSLAPEAVIPAATPLAATAGPAIVEDTAQITYASAFAAPAGPTVAAGRAGVQRPARPLDDAAMRREAPHLRQSQALMLAGGAGVLVGAIVGGGAGDVLMLGGAAVALYGLYQWAQQ